MSKKELKSLSDEELKKEIISTFRVNTYGHDEAMASGILEIIKREAIKAHKKAVGELLAYLLDFQEE